MAIVQMEEKGLPQNRRRSKHFVQTRELISKKFRASAAGHTMEDMSKGKPTGFIDYEREDAESDRAEGAHQKF